MFKAPALMIIDAHALQESCGRRQHYTAPVPTQNLDDNQSDKRKEKLMLTCHDKSETHRLFDRSTNLTAQ